MNLIGLGTLSFVVVIMAGVGDDGPGNLKLADQFIVWRVRTSSLL